MKIPKIFHRIWIGNNPMLEEYEYYGQTFMDLHPNWEYKLWTDDNLPVEKFQNSELYESDDGVVFKANIARIELLYLFGGLYADTDFEFYKNIEPLLKGYDHFFTGEKQGIIGNGIIGSVAGHPILKKLLDGMPESNEENKEYPPTIRTGVVYQTRTLNIDKINYLEPKIFFPTSPGTSYPANRASDFPESSAHHHWGQSWVGIEGNKNYKTWKQENQEEVKRLGL